MSFANYMMNFGILAGFYAGAMVLLRPVLLRLFTAQQRVILWWACVVFTLHSQIGGTNALVFPPLTASRSPGPVGDEPDLAGKHRCTARTILC